MDHDTDKNTNTTIEFSSITRLTTIDTTLAPYESDNDILNSIIIHPSTTNITYKSDVSCHTPSSQSRYSSTSISSNNSNSTMSISEGHTHSLSPSTHQHHHHPCGHPLYASMSTNKVFTNDIHDINMISNLKLEHQNENINNNNNYINIDEKQHILKPITIPSKSVSDFAIKSKPIPNYTDENTNYTRTQHSINHSNTYRQLEQQMIHNLQDKPSTIQKSISNPQLQMNNNNNNNIHPGNILTRYPTPPIHPLHAVQSSPNLQLTSQYSQACILPPNNHNYYYPYSIDTNIAPPVYYYPNTLPPSPMTPDSPMSIYRSRFMSNSNNALVLQSYHSNPIQCQYVNNNNNNNKNINNTNNNNNNVSYFAYNHDNGSIQKLTPVSIDTYESKTPISSFSYTQQPTTPIYTTTSTPSKSTKISDDSCNNNVNISDITIQKIAKNSGKYWDFAQCHCNEYLLTDFAIRKFQINKHKKTSIFLSYTNNNNKNNNNICDIEFLNKLFSFAPFKKMKHSLLIMENKEQNKIGIQIWKNINSYMGLRKSSKSDHQHIEKILKIALNNSNQIICDEILCQIIKQTNCSENILLNNRHKMDFYKLVRVWKLMCICCNIFCPSIELSKYLSCYLFNKAKDIEFGDGKISEMAVFALNALNNCMLNGNRKIEPIPYELTYIENCQLIPIKIYFLDDIFITILINSQTTCKQLCNIISNKFNIKYFEYFGLYEFETVDYNNELKKYNRRFDMNYKQKINDLKNILIDREININERIMDVFSAWIRCTNKKNKNLKFIYKCKILNKYKMNKDLFNINEWKFIYLNEYYNVMNNKYPNINENHLLHLYAIQLQATNQIHKKFDKNKNLKNKILQIQCKFYKDFTQRQCWIHYIKYLYNINNIKSFIGCIFFYCVGKINNKNKLFVNNDLIIGINHNSLIIINPPTKQIIHKFKLEQIITYGFKSKEFIFVAGTLIKQQKYQFITNYAKQINYTLQQYIEIRSSNK